MQTLGSREVYANAWMSVREDDIRRPDGSSGIYGVVDKLLGMLDVAPGMSAQRDRVFLATELVAGRPEREHTEQDMRSAWFNRADLDAMVRHGELCDAQSLAAYALLLLHEHP